MAKKLSRVIKVAKTTTYANISTALVLAASMNSTVDFSIIQKPNGTAGDLSVSADYQIQRMKRIKAKNIANPNTGTTAAALAALDTFSKYDWESIGVATGTLRGIGLQLSQNEKFDADNVGEGHAKVISDSTRVEAIERKEQLLTEIIDNAGTTEALPAPSAGTTPIFDALTKHGRKIQLLVDDYKHFTEDVIIVIHPTVADYVAKEMGQEFNNEAPIYKTGFTAKNSINGIPVLIDPSLNKFNGGNETNKVGAIVADVESFAFKAGNEKKDVDVDLGLTRYVGTYFYSIAKLVDPARVAKLTFSNVDYPIAPATSKKVSAV